MLGGMLVIAPSYFKALSLGFRLDYQGAILCLTNIFCGHFLAVALRNVAGLIKVASCVSQICFWQQLTPTARRIWPTCPLGASVLMNPSISRLANTIQPTKATISSGHSRFKLLKKRQRATQNLESLASIQIYPVKYKSLLMSNISVKLVKHGNTLSLTLTAAI